MRKRAVSPSLIAIASSLVLFGIPQLASAKHSGGSHGGGSHGGGSHGGSHSSFKSSGHSSFGGSHGSGHFSSAHVERAPKSSSHAGSSSFPRSGSFSSPARSFSASRSADNFGRASSSEKSFFGSSRGSESFRSSRDSSYASRDSRATDSRGESSKWQSFGNSGERSTFTSARPADSRTGNEWHSFGNANRGGWGEASRGFANSTRVSTWGDESRRIVGPASKDAGYSARGENAWHSFGGARDAAFEHERRSSGYASVGEGHAGESFARGPNGWSGWNRFAPNAPTSWRTPVLSSFESGGSFRNLGGGRFGFSGSGGSGFGVGGFGGSGFSGSSFGSGLSVIPNLLGNILSIGATAFGGHGLLAANVISLAARLFLSGIGSGGFGGGGYSADGAGFGPGGYGANVALEPAPVTAWPACVPAAPLWAPAPPVGVYCGGYGYQPYGWGGVGFVGAPGFGFVYR